MRRQKSRTAKAAVARLSSILCGVLIFYVCYHFLQQRCGELITPQECSLVARLCSEPGMGRGDGQDDGWGGEGLVDTKPPLGCSCGASQPRRIFNPLTAALVLFSVFDTSLSFDMASVHRGIRQGTQCLRRFPSDVGCSYVYLLKRNVKIET